MDPNLVYCLYDPDAYISTGTVFPTTRPGQFDNEPWNKSMLAWLEDRLDITTYMFELRKERLKLLQESDADPEEIDRAHNILQDTLANLETIKAKIELEKKYIAKEAEIELESLKAEIELENKDIAEDKKYTTKVSKQQVKRPRQIAKPGKQTTEVPKQQEKKLRLIVNNTEVLMQEKKVLEA